MGEPIKCPKCGGQEISISTWFRVIRGWVQSTKDDARPGFYDYDDYDYYLDSEFVDFYCHDSMCKYQWSEKIDINELLDED